MRATATTRLLSFRRSNITTITVTTCVLAASLCCGRGEPTWEVRWRLRGNQAEGPRQDATFGLNWDDDERTRGEYGLGVNGLADDGSPVTWGIRGSFTAEHVTPDFCGRAKWSNGSECFLITLRPRGDSPPREFQKRLDEAGLPDGSGRTYLMFLDGRTKEMSLAPKTPGAAETVWRLLPPSR